MLALSVCLALLAAVGNAAASVLQRRAAADAGAAGAAGGWWPGLVRRRVWVWGAALLGVSGLLQALALATGPLAVVQPVMSTELLFTLVLGGLVFRRRPDRRAWWAFGAMAAGLAAFWPGGAVRRAGDRAGGGLAAGGAGGRGGRGGAGGRGAAAAVGAAGGGAGDGDGDGVLRDGGAAEGRAGPGAGGAGRGVRGWQVYAAVAVGLASFLLLQVTFRAGTLAASQPALTLGDALLSVVLGVWLFDERVVVGARGSSRCSPWGCWWWRAWSWRARRW